VDAVSLWKSNIDHSLADLAQVGGFSAEGEAFLKPGGLMVAWEIRHDDFESLSAEEVDAICERFEGALGQLGDMDMLHVVHHRLPAPNYPEREFPMRAAALVDTERRAAFGNERYWITKTRIHLSHYFPPDARARLSSAFFAGSGASGGSASWQYEIERFGERTRAFGDALSGVAQARRLNSAEMFHDLHLCLTGLEHPIAPPSVPVHLDEALADQNFFGGLYPRVGQLHIRPVAINGYPAETIPQLLWFILHERGRMRFTLRWIPLDAITSQRHGNQVRGQWARRRQGLLQIILAAMNVPRTRANRHADEMVADAEDVIAHAAGGTPFGFLSLWAHIFDEDEGRAALRAREMVRRLQNAGAGARVEDVNAVEAFKGSQPGNGWSDVTRPLVSGINFAHLALASEPWPGTSTIDSPHFPPDTPAPLVCCSSGHAPFWLPPHSGGGVLHMLIVGPTGSGKSVLLALMAMAWTGLPDARVRWIDLDYSSFVAAHALEADYRELGNEGAPALCPLEHAGAADEDEFLLAFFTRLFARWQTSLSAERQEELAHSIGLGAGQELRRIRHLAGLIQDLALRRILNQYTEAGPWGHIFDGVPGNNRDSQVRVYETRGLMALGERAAAPALEWLLHEIERECAGAPTLIFVDEAWRLLNDPVSADWFYAALRTLRKRNAGIVMATQSVTEIAASPYCNLLLESCPAKIFLPNPEARGEHVRDSYQKLGLTRRQIEIIARAAPRSQYYYTSPLGSRLFNLDLGPIALALCGATGHPDLRRARELLARGGEFLEAWLAERGVGDLAARLGSRTPASERFPLFLNGGAAKEERA
jgi:type IV secretory pathway VirB4 component